MTAEDRFELTTDLGRIDLARVHRWLCGDAPWAIGRSRETVELAAQNSLNFGVLDPDGGLLAYARAVTDHATFAWICDVYVDPSARGIGLGIRLAQAIVETLRPLHLKRVVLATHDAQSMYERFGFTALPEPDEWMILSSK